MRLVQRAHLKGCLCERNDWRIFQSLVIKDPVRVGAVYMGLYGDEDWTAHTWDLEFQPWSPEPRVRDIFPVDPQPVSDERLAEILRDMPRPKPAPMDPGVYRRQTEEPARVFPAPLVTSDDDQAPEARPKPVTDLEAYATARGWAVTVTYAEGWVPHARLGTPSAKPKISWALRMVRESRRAVAVRMDSAWDSFWVLSPEGMVPHATLAAFQEALN